MSDPYSNPVGRLKLVSHIFLGLFFVAGGVGGAVG